MSNNYRRLDQRTHVLTRPGMYIGTTSFQEYTNFHTLDEKCMKIKLEKNFKILPGLFKIYDEAISNAVDNAIKNKSQKFIKVEIDEKTLAFKISNNACKIPLTLMNDDVTGTKELVPRIIFGQLLSGSNYENNVEDEEVAGTNGLGIKLTNIFSKSFSVEISRKAGKIKYFREVWKNNMEMSEPFITSSIATENDDIITIEFVPDLSKFENMDSKDKTNFVNALKKRTMDCLPILEGKGLKNCSVFLNNKDLGQNISLKEYVQKFWDIPQEDPQNNEIIAQETKNKFSFVLVQNSNNPSQTSWVNGTLTGNGGKHMSIIQKLITSFIKEKNKNFSTLSSQEIWQIIQANFSIFFSVFVQNPVFTSQTKDQLASFSDKGEITLQNTILSKINNIVKIFIEERLTTKLKKTSSKDDGTQSSFVNVPKLVDAKWAGSKKTFKKASLILTEGLSAQSFAVKGRAAAHDGISRFGVFPLKGKFINVRSYAISKIFENEEFINLKKILGLRQEYTYETQEQFDTLRYGSVTLLTDADEDGTHIRGLLLNMFTYFWPKLLTKHNFLTTLQTPLLKATKGKETLDFFTINAYEEESAKKDLSKYSIKYFKGLGTSKDEDARDAFRNLDKNLVSLTFDSKNDKESIELAFSKESESSDLRKEWLRNYNKDSYVRYGEIQKLNTKEFVDNSLIHFSIYSTKRAIPSLFDGLKPSQRKILHYMLTKNVKNIKVAQLSGYVSAETAYHHGEASLQAAIVSMAQRFPGANNIPLLKDEGNFGSRLENGKNAAAPRYIYTGIEEITKLLFPPEDLPVLSYVVDDGLKVEPENYVPILPLALINGFNGIGTGFSTNLCGRDPQKILDFFMEHVIKGNNTILSKESEKILNEIPPYFGKNFKGKITKESAGKYKISGNIQTNTETQSITITELPTQIPLNTFLDFLKEKLGKTKIISNIVDESPDPDSSIKITISFSPKNFTEENIKTITELLTKKITTSISEKNINLFSSNDRLLNYKNPASFINEYISARLELYSLRKKYLLENLEEDIEKLSYLSRFTQLVLDSKIKITDTEENINKILAKDPYKGPKDIVFTQNVRNLTREKHSQLLSSIETKKEEKESLSQKSIFNLWESDLCSFLEKKNQKSS